MASSSNPGTLCARTGRREAQVFGHAFAAAALIVAALALAGCRPEARANPGGSARAAPGATTGVRLFAPEKVRFAPRVVVTGNLKPEQAAQLSMQVPGRLDKIAVRRGELVKQGAVLAQLDSAAAQATVAQAQAGLKAAEAQLALAEDGLARATAIRQKEGGVTDAQLTQAQGQRDLAAAGVLNAKAQLQQAEVHLRNHTLRAPFSGVVLRIPDGVGVTVGPGAPLFSLEATGLLVLESSVTQEDAAELVRGGSAKVTVPATGAQSADAKIRTILPSVDPQTNRVPIEVEVSNADGRFAARAFARAELSAGAEREALRVRATALVQKDGAFALWASGPDNKARAVRVRVLGEQGELTVIQPENATVLEGARIVDLPPLNIAEGALLVEAVAR